MPKFNVTVIESIQRTAVYQVEADDADDIDSYNVYEGRLLWDDVEDLHDAEIYDVKRAEDDE